MKSLITKEITNQQTWNQALSTMPHAHILQTWEWGEFKRVTTGWAPTRLMFVNDDRAVAMASIQTRRIGPLRVMYIPRGPAMDYGDTDLVETILQHLEQFAQKQAAIWLKIDPDVQLGTGVPGEEDAQVNEQGAHLRDHLSRRGWRFSQDQVQFRNSVCIDLQKSEDEILMAMSQNTRRKVRTAEKKDVTIRKGSVEDLPILYDLYRITGARDEFLIRPPAYYEKAWKDFLEAGLAHTLIAEVDGKAIAHVIVFHFGQVCWQFYGASSNDERQRMPNYALQWETIKWAKAQGYKYYDMWGAPDDFVETDRMWSVYEFKRGFRGTVVRHIGAWDFAPYPLLYQVYTRIWPWLLNLLRRMRRT